MRLVNDWEGYSVAKCITSCIKLILRLYSYIGFYHIPIQINVLVTVRQLLINYFKKILTWKI